MVAEMVNSYRLAFTLVAQVRDAWDLLLVALTTLYDLWRNN